MYEKIQLDTNYNSDNEGYVKARYTHLCASRDVFLQRAREASAITIPSLLPREGHSSHTNLVTPYQSVGARGVNNLSSKLLLTLLPPNSPFFRLIIDDQEMQELTKGSDKGVIEEALSKVERAVMQEIEVKAIRVPVFEALKQLIVTGNVLLYMPPKGGLRVFKLDRYVCKRDMMGNILEIITLESLAYKSLPESAKELLTENEGSTADLRNVDLYTCVKLEKNRWKVHQEIEGMVVPGSEGSYPKNKLAWIPLRFTRIDGEDYGRGYVEEYIGDLRSLEALTKAIVEGSAAAAKVLFLVRPNGTTRLKTLADSPNGAIVTGDANDVTTLQIQKATDFRIAESTAKVLEDRLAFAFLLNSAIQRDAERVTAEEIRLMSQELEASLGGIYSLLSQEFQLPMVNLMMNAMQKEKKLPKFPDESLKPLIVTGVEALGRGQDLNKLANFLKHLQPFGPEILQREMNIRDYIDRLGASLGIDMDGLVKSQEQLQQEAQQAQQAQQDAMMQEGIKNVAEKAAPQMMIDAAQQQQIQEQ